MQTACNGFKIAFGEFRVVAAVKTAVVEKFRARQVVRLGDVFFVKRLARNVSCDHGPDLDAGAGELVHIFLSQLRRFCNDRKGKGGQE